MRIWYGVFTPPPHLGLHESNRDRQAREWRWNRTQGDKTAPGSGNRGRQNDAMDIPSARRLDSTFESFVRRSAAAISPAWALVAFPASLGSSIREWLGFTPIHSGLLRIMPASDETP